MKKKHALILAVLATIIIAIIAMAIIFSNSAGNLEQLADYQIQDVDLSMIPDGTYTGRHKVFPINVEVKVVVSNHQITEIELVKHFNGQGSAAEVIPGRVMDAQSLDVDIVTGATYSSKVILKAIKAALSVNK